MSKNKIIDVIKEKVEPFIIEQGFELFNIEYVREGKDWALRIYIDNDGTVSTDDCEMVSRFISPILDEIDIIDKYYYLEVSSPGIDRPLLKDTDYDKYKGEQIDVFLYKAINGKKMLTGQLEGLENNIIKILDDNKKIIEIPKEQTSKVKLAVIF